MSRNLCMTSCDRCQADEVGLIERPRQITPDEAGVYFGEFRGMLVANAVCPDCGARYLAWCQDNRPRGRSPDYGERYFDLSYRKAFNDEPCKEDIPKPSALRDLDAAIKRLVVPDITAVRGARALLAKKLGWKD